MAEKISICAGPKRVNLYAKELSKSTFDKLVKCSFLAIKGCREGILRPNLVLDVEFVAIKTLKARDLNFIRVFSDSVEVQQSTITIDTLMPKKRKNKKRKNKKRKNKN